MKLLHLKNFPIFRQLQIEEALLRTSDENFCIINEGTPPAIVMGISGKLNELVHEERHSKNPIPIIKRFSGGGTVVVDTDTIFVSFLFQKDFHDFAPYPEPIMKWTEGFYQKAFDMPDFLIRENDYVIGTKKCGGNAQYLRKNRWLHHTTFLWNFQKSHMDLLLHPNKTPQYRKERSHEEFLTPLHPHFSSKENLIQGIKNSLPDYSEIILDNLQVDVPHRKSTQEIVFAHI